MKENPPEDPKPGMCKSCGHPYDRHIFGGACFYCDCKRCVY